MISTECSGIIIGPCDPGSKLLLKEFKITFLSFFSHSALWAYI